MPTNYWVHNLNPVLLPLWGNFAIRYYGLGYLLGFLIGYWLLQQLITKKITPLTHAQLESLIVALIIGTLIGGRLGYMLLYTLPDFLKNPLLLFRLWEGGMSSHGGFLGVAIACWWISKKHGLSFNHLGDLICASAPPGLCLVRIANFINGELWGKVSQVPWAVIFPQSAPLGTPLSSIPPRHPSQLYEAFLEGLVLFIILQLRLWKSRDLASPGRLTGEFLLLYALVRILGEQFREPDASLLLGISRGVFYSLFVAFFGIYFIATSYHHPRLQPPTPL